MSGSSELPAVIDSHCHLDFPDFAAERDDVVARALAAGVERMVTISTRVRKFPQIIEIASSLSAKFSARSELILTMHMKKWM